MAKLTPELLESKITGEAYHQFQGTTVTICCLTLENGYNTIGQSACIDQSMFNAEIGKGLAREDAFSKLWQLYGFASKEASLQAHYPKSLEYEAFRNEQ